MEEADGDEGPHFAEVDPTGRFGRWDQVLGRGAFKVVYKAFDTQEGTEVAWNQVRVSELMSTKDAENKEERDRLFAEIRVLKALKHKNIMSFFDSWYDAKTYTVNFITELFTSGTLRQYRKRHKHIDEEVVKRWAWQILCGLVYLHGHNPPIIHRDLKCDNIFINGSDGVVKIGDLGLATMLRSRTAPQSVLGTPEFMAPELYEEEYDDRVDVYSFGMCLLELSTMEYPYSECKNAAQIYRKVSLGVRPAGLQKVASPELAEFINVCISAREQRPRARQLLKHSYFESIRKDKALVSSRSDAALAAAGIGAASGDSVSDHGGFMSGPVSRTASSLNEMMAAAWSATQPAASSSGLNGQPSASSVLGGSSGNGSAAPLLQLYPLSRTISAEASHSDKAHSDKAHSDTASVRSQRSNASELANAALENIAEEGEASAAAVAAADGPDDAASGGAITPQGTGSRTASQRGSPQPAYASPAKPGSPTSSDGCRCDSTERRFSVKGNWLDGDKRIQLRLRICERTGISRTVEFEFDVAVDTAASVASEMVSDLELTVEDASVIASCIRDELDRLSALPEINAYASMSLAKAAEVLESSLTSSALEQAHNSSGGRDFAPMVRMNGVHDHCSADNLLAFGRVTSGRFSQEVLPPGSLSHGVTPPAVVLLPAPTPTPAPTPMPPLAAVLQAQQVVGTGQPSLSNHSSIDKEQPSTVAPLAAHQPAAHPVLRPSGGSTGSVSSVTSALDSSASASAQASEQSHATAIAASAVQAAAAAGAGQQSSLARMSPRARGASMDGQQPSLLRLSPRAGGASLDGRPPAPPRPVSPLGAPHSVPVEMPSPNQRVMRSNSVDALSVLSRSSSMPPGRDAVASPMGVGSGALSPNSGMLSPSTAVPERRPGLTQLFQNLQELQELAGSRVNSPGLEAALVAASMSMPPPPALTFPPQLVQPGAGRPLPLSSSHPTLDTGSGAGGSDATLFRRRSEAFLAALPSRPNPFLSPGVAPASAPTAGATLAAAAELSDITSPTSGSNNVSPRLSASQAAEAIHRLDLQSTAPLPGIGMCSASQQQPGLARRSGGVLSAPPSKLPSRDGSPTREGSLSPTRVFAGAPLAASANSSSGDLAGQLYGKPGARHGPPIRDKEALRRQAADAMKAVELRSLNLLEGGMFLGRATRGVPMAAAKSSMQAQPQSLASAGGSGGMQAQPQSLASAGGSGGMQQQAQSMGSGGGHIMSNGSGGSMSQQPQQQSQQQPPAAMSQQQHQKQQQPPMKQQQHQKQQQPPMKQQQQQHPAVAVMANGGTSAAAPPPPYAIPALRQAAASGQHIGKPGPGTASSAGLVPPPSSGP